MGGEFRSKGVNIALGPGAIYPAIRFWGFANDASCWTTWAC